jgi:predicted SnoaL-like aldol condensation-catalyzing enzyme
MLDYTLTPEFIKKIVEEIESDENVTRKRVAWNSNQVRTGKLKPYVEQRIKEMYPLTHSMYTVTDYSVLSKVVNKKAKAYKEPPIRRIPEADKATQIYQELLDKYAFNQAMKFLDQSYNQHKHALIACFMDRISGPSTGSQYFWKFYSLEPYEYDVIKDDDGKVKVVILSYPTDTLTSGQGDGYNALIAESGSADESQRERFYSFWTNEYHLTVKVTGKKGEDKLVIEFVPTEGNPKSVNPYGILPFVYAPMDFDKNYPNSSPLPMQTVEFNALMSVYLTSANMQVGVLRVSHPEKQKISVVSHGLYTALDCPQSSRPEDKPTEMEFISPTPNMSGHKEAIVTYLTSILDEQGISGSQVVNPSEDFSSGFDRLLAQADVQSIIEENQELYLKVEQAVYNIISKQLASVNQNILPEASLQVIYKKPKVMISDKEKLENLKLMKELGLWAEWELIQQYDPNLSENEAKLKLKDIKKERMDQASAIISNSLPMAPVENQEDEEYDEEELDA